MANSSGTHREPSHASSSFNGVGGGNPINGHSVPVPENSVAAPTLKHNPGLSTEWTAEEQSILEEGLTKYASESNIIRYAKIALPLPNKTVRDVALRCRWMSKKENSKRRKEDHNLTRKNKDKKEKVTDALGNSSQLSARPGYSPYNQQMITMDNHDGISYNAIGGATGHLLQQNAQAFEQISANFATHQMQVHDGSELVLVILASVMSNIGNTLKGTYSKDVTCTGANKIHENISLFCQARDNILKLLNNMSDVPEKMKQMPPVPERMNEELANSILPHTTVSMQS